MTVIVNPGPLINKSLVGIGIAKFFDNVASLLADDKLDYFPTTPLPVSQVAKPSVVAGSFLSTHKEGFHYRVASANATDHHLTTAGGVKLYVEPEGDKYNVQAFGAVGDGVADDTIAIQTAINACPEYYTVFFPNPQANNVRSWPKHFYLISDHDNDGICLRFARRNVLLLGSAGFRKPTLLCLERGKKILYSVWKNVSLVGMYVYGDGNIFQGGEDATCTGFYLRVADDASQDSADYDGVISDCFFAGCWRCADIVGRNFEYSRNLHAGFIQGLYVEPADPAENVGNADTMRGERVFDNRFHSSARNLHVADVTGTAQAATASTITLASGDSAENDYYRGYTVTIESGTGLGQTRLIIESNSTTKLCTLSETWAVTPDATSVYRIKSPHAFSSCIWLEPGDFPAITFSYEYGHHIVNNQYDQVIRFYVGPVRGLNLSHNTGYNLEGGKNTDGNLGVVSLLRSDFGEEVAGIVHGNTMRGVSQAADGIGIYCNARNVKITDNTITTFQRHGIFLDASSGKCDVQANTIDQCSGAQPDTYDGIVDGGVENYIDNNRITGSGGSRRMRYGINAAGTRTYLGLNNYVARDCWTVEAIRIGSITGSYGLVRNVGSDTAGMTWEVGMRKTILEPVADGASTLRCTIAGTSGSAGAVTCTANATATITVNTSGTLSKGNYVLISGDATIRRIIAISGTTVTLSEATTASGSDLSVSFSAPEFKVESTLEA